FSLLEESDDLFVGKSCGLHIRHSPKLADFVPSIWYGSEGAGHDVLLRACTQFYPLRTKKLRCNFCVWW
ncbi:hypothetical protein, partial [Limnohabitans sp. Jir72]|uniref:hypothetical protein n=1 Tax=Limnohabitans sp. Jir72 TaxID=1977909 RepID=UPI001E52BC7E